MNEPKAMQEIHAIREQLSREKRGLTIEERVARSNANIYRLQKEFGFKIAEELPEPRYEHSILSPATSP